MTIERFSNGGTFKPGQMPVMLIGGGDGLRERINVKGASPETLLYLNIDNPYLSNDYKARIKSAMPTVDSKDDGLSDVSTVDLIVGLMEAIDEILHRDFASLHQMLIQIGSWSPEVLIWFYRVLDQRSKVSRIQQDDDAEVSAAFLMGGIRVIAIQKNITLTVIETD